MRIIRYRHELKSAWDRFVEESKNGTFLHLRDYMEYHADRFKDHSLLIYNEKGRLIALLPGNESGATYHSHQGLTYGSLILSVRSTTPEVCAVMQYLTEYLRACGFEKLIYKKTPLIYQRYPSDEDSYALFLLGATFYARNVSAAIRRERMLPFSYNRTRCARKIAVSGACRVVEGDNLTQLWSLLEETLRDRHQAKPVHSLAEISLLQERFPEYIRSFTLERDGIPEAGVVVYAYKGTVHTQYLCSSPTGRKSGALDYLLTHLITKRYEGFEWFDLGTSNENGGRVLNQGLMVQKEGFGARAVVYDIYELDLNHDKIPRSTENQCAV